MCVSFLIVASQSLCGMCLQVDEEFNGFCYVYEGKGTIGGTKAGEQQALVMGKGASCFLPNSGRH